MLHIYKSAMGILLGLITKQWKGQTFLQSANKQFMTLLLKSTLSKTYIACSKVFDQQTYLLFEQAKKKNYKRIKDILHNKDYHIMLHERYNANTLCRA
jgi:hypothetical protein